MALTYENNRSYNRRIRWRTLIYCSIFILGTALLITVSCRLLDRAGLIRLQSACLSHVDQPNQIVYVLLPEPANRLMKDGHIQLQRSSDLMFRPVSAWDMFSSRAVPSGRIDPWMHKHDMPAGSVLATLFVHGLKNSKGETRLVCVESNEFPKFFATVVTPVDLFGDKPTFRISKVKMPTSTYDELFESLFHRDGPVIYSARVDADGTRGTLPITLNGKRRNLVISLDVDEDVMLDLTEAGRGEASE